MNRRQKLLLNTGSGIIKQLTALVCGFILPRYILIYYGSTVNALVASAVNFLSFISLLDMGVGAVVQSNLYEPLAKKDNYRISAILSSSRRFFTHLAIIFLAYLAVLSFAFPKTVSSEFETWYSLSLLLIIAISTFVQYLFGMTNQLLLNADQKAYIPLLLATFTIIINTLGCVILIKRGFSIHVVKLFTTAVYVIRPIGQAIYIKAHYKISKKIKTEVEPIRQKWNGFSQHLAAVVCQNIDTVVLTIFAPLESVSVYNIYYLVTSGVNQVVLTAATGLESMFGNMIANDEKEKLKETFSTVELIVHFSVTVIFSIAAITITPFVKVYTRGITDADYNKPLFGVILVAAYGLMCLRIPYFRIVKAAGHYKETQNGAYISAGINIIVTILLVFRFGLIGAAIGTLCAMGYHTCYFVWYLRRHILIYEARRFVRLLSVDCLIAALSFWIATAFSMEETTYVSWIFYAVKVGLTTAGCAALSYGVFLGKEIRSIMIKT